MHRKPLPTRILIPGALTFFLVAALGYAFTVRFAPAIWLTAALAAALASILLLISARRQAPRPGTLPAHAPEPAWMLDSAHPMIFSTTLDGLFTSANPAAERAFALHATELVGKRRIQEFFAPGELERVRKSIARRQPELLASHETLSPFDFCVHSLISLPPSQVRPVHFQLQPASGDKVPASLYLSVLRDHQGQPCGLMAVAVNLAYRLERQHALRESSERYRDLFDHTADLIAVLSADGSFQYSNPAWKTCFAFDDAAFQRIERFDECFAQPARPRILELFQRALRGDSVEAFPLQTLSSDGRPLELEISLSLRRTADPAPTLRCIVRDLTHHKQRERRLALQLTTTQIVSQSASSQYAAVRILETLCLSLGWDAAFLWHAPHAQDALRFHTGWASPDPQMDDFLQQTMVQTAAPSLATAAHQDNRVLWVEDFSAETSGWSDHPALRYGLNSAWAVPVHAGHRQIAVLEFFSRQRLRKDHETMATVESILTPLGQMLARSREQERADELHHTQQILLDTIADGICAINPSGVVTTMNPAARKLLRLGMSRDMSRLDPSSTDPSRIDLSRLDPSEAADVLPHLLLHDLLHASRPGGTADCGDDCALAAMLRQPKTAAGEIVIWRRDHSSFPAEFSLTPILENGRYSGTVMSFRDITQRFALDKLKDEFVSTVSHELRTPLTSIRGALGLLSSGILGEVNDKAANLLRIALSNSDRLVRLINDILDLERIQSGREPLSFRAVALDEIVQLAIDGMQPVAEAAGVQLIHDANAVHLQADPDRLLQVLTNLLSNAIKFSPDQSTISVTLRVGSSAVVLSVIDQGRGIPADKLDKIFDRFQQVDASDSRQKGGSGLGLAICRTIVLQHGGKIWAERNPVRGSTFRVLLPLHPEIKTTQKPPEESMSSGTLLVADANDKSRAAVASMLRRHGYQVVEAATAQQTLDALWADEDKLVPRALEAILLDASLHQLYGRDILPQLRQQQPAQPVPVVLLSMGSPDPQSLLPDGPDAWIRKTTREDQLLRDLAQVLSLPGEPARILVVEDDQDLARIIADVFARSGMQVEQAHTRQDALRACATYRPQLIVLDLSLPDGDGFNVVDWLRQNEDFAHLPLVVYSAREIPQQERALLRLGPTQFLTKARVEPQQLESLVITMLRRSRQRRESAIMETAAAQESRPPFPHQQTTPS